MVALETPICDFGWKAPEFNLIGIDNKYYSFQDVKGTKGTLVMFICNHCPYVKSVIHRIVEDVKLLKEKGIGVIAIMSNDVNDPKYGEEDSFDNMKLFSEKNNFVFPYVYDETQIVGRNYNAVCTPDFFGFNENNELQYRGRLEESKMEIIPNAKKELLEAMIKVSETGYGPIDQIPSIGCSIKWKE
tara:strand:+ start:275 stop:835 length:561 start_codon:yes stop_codon:yes gene_type:complete